MFDIIKSGESAIIKKAVSTSSGMWGLWDYEEYRVVVTYEDWDALFCEDDAIKQQIAKAKFVPINIQSDGCFQFRVKIDETLSSREKQYIFVQSQEYLFESSGQVVLSGIEAINRTVSDRDGIMFNLRRGKYSVSICIVDWKEELKMKLFDETPSSDALPDFIVLINSSIDEQMEYRQELETFNKG